MLTIHTKTYLENEKPPVVQREETRFSVSRIRRADEHGDHGEVRGLCLAIPDLAQRLLDGAAAPGEHGLNLAVGVPNASGVDVSREEFRRAPSPTSDGASLLPFSHYLYEY